VATDFQPPHGADVATSPSECRLVRVRVDRLRAELRALDLDIDRFAYFAEMTPAHVGAVISSGLASKATLRRIRRGLRVAWAAKDPDPSHYGRMNLLYLSEAAQ